MFWDSVFYCLYSCSKYEIVRALTLLRIAFMDLKKSIFIISMTMLLMACQSVPQLVPALNNPGGDVVLTFERQQSADAGAREASILLMALRSAPFLMAISAS